MNSNPRWEQRDYKTNDEPVEITTDGFTTQFLLGYPGLDQSGFRLSQEDSIEVALQIIRSLS